MTYEIDHHYRNRWPEADLWSKSQDAEFNSGVDTLLSDTYRLIATFYSPDALVHAEMFKALLEQHVTIFDKLGQEG